MSGIRTPVPLRGRFALLLCSTLVAFWMAEAPARAAGPTASGAAPAAQVRQDAADGWQRALLDRYCIACHNERLLTADLALDTHDVTRIADAPAVWETVARKLRAGAMPPLPRPRPDAATYDRFIGWLEAELDRAAAADPNPGRTEAFHRLNRTEYHHAIRDLLDLEIDVAELLPADGASYGFDNIAGVLGVSPTLLERYLAAARRISRVAVGRPAPSATAEVFRLASDLPQDDWVAGMPFGTRGGGAFRHVFPEDADYLFRVRLARNAGDNLAVFEVPHTLEMSLDGALVRTFTVGGPPPADAPRDNDELPRVARPAADHRPRLGVPPAGQGRAARVARDVRAEDRGLPGNAAPALSAAVHQHHRRRHPRAAVPRQRHRHRAVRRERRPARGGDAEPPAHLRLPPRKRCRAGGCPGRGADRVRPGRSCRTSHGAPTAGP